MSEDLRLTDDEGHIDAILRSMTEDDLELDTPPDSVWAGIEAAVAESDSESEERLAPVVSLASRRRLPMMLGAVAAALVVVAGLAVVLVSGNGTDPIEVASAELVYVPDDSGFVDLGIGRSADVTLLEDGDAETIRVDVADLPVAGDDNALEIWLIGVTDGEIEIIQTLGLVEDPTEPGAFAVPADFDRAAYDAVAVDISIEPHDGNEAHSGMSLVRGVLTA